MNRLYYTKEGYNKLRDTLKTLKTKGRINIAKQISDARQNGDLSENADYDAAKQAQEILEIKISNLEKKLSQCQIIEKSDITTDSVSILSNVKIKNIDTNIEMDYKIVPEEEASLKEGKISIGSPLVKGILGKNKGDILNIKVPNGILKIEILDIQ